MGIELRPYQRECLIKVTKAYHAGKTRQIVVMATGTGKTVCFGTLANLAIKQTGKKVLILAHRQELLHQSKEEILSINPNLIVEIEQAENYANHQKANVVIASVPTLGQTNSKRIQRFNPNDYALIIIDEIHHLDLKNSSYTNILKHFKILKSEPENNTNKALFLGVTATPRKMEGYNFNKLFDEVIYTYDILDAIQDGWLCRIKAFRVNTATDLSNIKKVAGDFNQGELGEAVNTITRNSLIVKTYLDLLENKKALVFAVDVEHAKALCQEFLNHGITATYIIGTTTPEDRQQRLANFKSGKIKVIVNCMVLTEGFNSPDIEAILLSRPTQSNILFRQMLGRGTRLAEGKTHLTVIDFCDITYKQNLQTASSILNLPGNLDFKGKDILSVKPEIDRLLDLAPNFNLEKLDLDKIKYAIEKVDLLSGLKIPEEISVTSTYDWHKLNDGWYRLGLGQAGDIDIEITLTDTYTLNLKTFNPVTKKQAQKFLGGFDSLSKALKFADNYTAEKFHKQLPLVKTTAHWRKEKMSEAQLKLLKKLKVSDIVLAQCDKGQASRLISKLLNHARMNQNYL